MEPGQSGVFVDEADCSDDEGEVGGWGAGGGRGGGVRIT